MIPTPTPLPETAPPIDMPDISLWDHAATSIQFWNSASEITIVFQAIILVGILIGIAISLYRRMNRTTTNEE